MSWLDLLSWFWGGAFLANAVPHLMSGMAGKSFQTPFAKPPGEGLSTSTVNVLWGAFNLVLSYVLLCRVGHPIWSSGFDALAPAAGALAIALFSARHFGRFHGGNSPQNP